MTLLTTDKMARTEHPVQTEQHSGLNRAWTLVQSVPPHNNVHCRLGYLHRRLISWKSRKQLRGGPLHRGTSHTEHLARVLTASVPSFVRRPNCLQTIQYFCFPCRLSVMCIRLSSMQGSSDFIFMKSSGVNCFSTCWLGFPAPRVSAISPSPGLLNTWLREWSSRVAAFDGFSSGLYVAGSCRGGNRTPQEGGPGRCLECGTPCPAKQKQRVIARAWHENSRSVSLAGQLKVQTQRQVQTKTNQCDFLWIGYR